MNQSDFNKQQRYESLLQEAKTKGLGFKFLLDEFKRNHWNLNLKQAEEIALTVNQNTAKVLFYADDLNILNVDNKTKKAIQKQKKHKDDYNYENI